MIKTQQKKEHVVEKKRRNPVKKNLKRPSADFLFHALQNRQISLDDISLHSRLTELEKENEMMKFSYYALQALMDEVPETSIYITDITGKFIAVNKTKARRLGICPEQAVGKTDMELNTGDIQATKKSWRDTQRVLKKGIKLAVEEKRGARFVLATKVPIKVPHTKKVIGMIGFSRDISAIRQNEVLLAQTKKKLEAQAKALMETYKSLQHQNIELEKLNTTKDKLFIIVTNGLKNPFGSLIGFSEVLLSNMETMAPQSIQTFLGYIHETSRNIYVSLENLFRWVSLQTNKVHFSRTYIDITELLQKTVQTHLTRAVRRSILLHVDCPLKTYIQADGDSVSCVLRNLLANAIKFSPDGSTVKICVTKKNEHICITVTDKGKGIPKAYHKRIFELGEEHPPTDSSEEQGLGLGLVIAKALIEMNKGTISVVSKKAKGSTFTVSLPIK